MVTTITQISTNSNGRQAAAPSPTAEIAQLVAEIRQTVDEMERLEETIQEAKARLRVLLAQRGESWTDDDGYARLVKDSTRRSYDLEALDGLIVKSEWWGKRLRKYRREFTVRGGVQVK